MQGRFSGMDARIEACSAQGTVDEQTMADHASRLAEIERAVVTPIQHAPAPSQFDSERQPYLHIVRLSTADMVAKGVVHEVVGIKAGGWDRSASSQGIWKMFTVMFNGAPVTAARRANKALAALRILGGALGAHASRSAHPTVRRGEQGPTPGQGRGAPPSSASRSETSSLE